MRTVNYMPETLREKAATLLSERAVMDETLKTLLSEMAKHHIMITQMWAEARKEIENQGIKMADDEVIGFTFDTKEFNISRR